MDTEQLIGCSLFRGMDPHALESLLPVLKPRQRRYRKGETILHAGSTTRDIGLILSGGANIVVESYWGETTLFGHISQGEIFAEAYAALPDRELAVRVVSDGETKVVFVRLERILESPRHDPVAGELLIRNLIGVSALRNLGLSSRMMHTAPKGIRNRVLSYLTEQALHAGSNRFSIPFSRQQLADYLGVDRSALSNELSKMRSDGLIDFRKNDFVLYANTGRRT